MSTTGEGEAVSKEKLPLEERVSDWLEKQGYRLEFITLNAFRKAGQLPLYPLTPARLRGFTFAPNRPERARPLPSPLPRR